MKRFFRVPFLVIGYFLYVQAALAALLAFGVPENLILIWVISFGVATVGHGLIKTARRWQLENQPTKELPVPEPRHEVDSWMDPQVARALGRLDEHPEQPESHGHLIFIKRSKPDTQSADKP